MAKSEDDILEDIYIFMEHLEGDDILRDEFGKEIKRISGKIASKHNKYLKVAARKWRRIATRKIASKLEPLVKQWAKRADKAVPSTNNVKAIIDLMPKALRFKFLTVEDYNVLEPLGLFDDYIELIDDYTEVVNKLYEKMADRCADYYRGTGTDELDALQESHEKWAEYYYQCGYCCLTSVPVTALYYSSRNKRDDKDIVLRYPKDLPPGTVERPGHGLSDNKGDNINKPARLYLMHEMELRLRNTADPKTLNMEIISFAKDPAKQEEIKERYDTLGKVIFACRNVEEILLA